MRAPITEADLTAIRRDLDTVQIRISYRNFDCHKRAKLPIGPRLAESYVSKSMSFCRFRAKEMYFHCPKHEDTVNIRKSLENVAKAETIEFRDRLCHLKIGFES
jgi:hypothetical protein